MTSDVLPQKHFACRWTGQTGERLESKNHVSKGDASGVIKLPVSDLGSLIVSLSNGSLCLLRPHDARGLSLTNSWHAHDNEPWVAAWNYWNTNVVYSGLAMFHL
jgi:hypothetical protein